MSLDSGGAAQGGRFGKPSCCIGKINSNSRSTHHICKQNNGSKTECCGKNRFTKGYLKMFASLITFHFRNINIGFLSAPESFGHDEVNMKLFPIPPKKKSLELHQNIEVSNIMDISFIQSLVSLQGIPMEPSALVVKVSNGVKYTSCVNLS
jgi:hypothetical protein